jgi:hypothetical protein
VISYRWQQVCVARWLADGLNLSLDFFQSQFIRAALLGLRLQCCHGRRRLGH